MRTRYRESLLPHDQAIKQKCLQRDFLQCIFFSDYDVCPLSVSEHGGFKVPEASKWGSYVWSQGEGLAGNKVLSKFDDCSPRCP